MSLQKRRFAVLTAILLFGLSVSTLGQPPTKPGPGAVQGAGGVSNEDLLQRIRLLELKAAEPVDTKSEKVTVPLATAIIGSLAVLAAALIGILGQRLAAKNAASIAAASAAATAELASNAAAERLQLARKAAEDTAELARVAALYKHAEQMIDFKLKQIESFYAPIFAALRQSRMLYNKMLEQIERDAPDRYFKNTTAVGNDFRYLVKNKEGEASGFYLVDQLPAIKGNASAMQLVDLMLDLGKSICTIITTHAGLASEDLIEMLGEYMAHHAILSAIRGGPETTAFEPGHNKLGAFPRGLDARIEERLKALSKEIDDYDKVSGRSLSLV
jgi:hypothetical protein